MVDRCRKLYNVETQMPPAYLQARNHLYEGRIDNFIDIMKSLISSVPYNVHKEKIDEGYFHTIFHVICSTLGFIIVSEKENVERELTRRYLEKFPEYEKTFKVYWVKPDDGARFVE